MLKGEKGEKGLPGPACGRVEGLIGAPEAYAGPKGEKGDKGQKVS